MGIEMEEARVVGDEDMGFPKNLRGLSPIIHVNELLSNKA
jgi:hypothetical protein